MAGLHYVFDPTGWAVQLNMNFSRFPRGCNANATGAARLGASSPMCDGGTC